VTATIGSESVSTNAQLVVDSVPLVQILSPKDQSLLLTNTDYVVHVEASSDNGSISSVTLYMDGTKLSEKTIPPYDFNIRFTDQGIHILNTRATDNLGVSRFGTAIFISTALIIVTDPTSQFARIGDNVRFSVP